MNVEKKFLQAIRDFNLISPKDKILIAYSAGVDSSVLTYLLNKFKNYLNIDRLAIAYLNHGIRKEANEEESFIEQVAQKFGIEFFIKKVNVPELARSENKSIEEKGREERYKFFTEILQRKDFNKLATGHHLSDLVETVILWFIQGNKKGLQGFKPKENFIIRPLYYLKKDEIKKYAMEKNIEFKEDMTNYSTEYMRNKVRLEVIPLLKKVNPSIEDSLFVMSQLISVDEEYFSQRVKEIELEKNQIDITDIEKPVLYRFLDLWVLNKTKCKVSYRQIYNILKNLDKANYRLQICKDFYLVKKNNIIQIEKITHENNISYEYYLKPGQEVFIKEANLKIKAFITDKENLPDIKNEKNVVCFDIPDLNENTLFIVRNRKEGDRFKPFGSSEKKLKDVFINLKVPKNMRKNIPLVIFRDKILWLAGYKRSAYFPIKENSKQIICFEIKEV